ncbi:MAG: gamma-glutamyl-gamma-aminobutyrate hydrolase family protein [Anaerolineae bacterium]
MIIFVDNEHEEGYKRVWGQAVMAARTRIKYRLEDITGDECLMLRYHKVDPSIVEKYQAKALFISGNSAEPHHYAPNDILGLHEVLVQQKIPIFAFCGGFQSLGEALNVPNEKMGYITPPEYDNLGQRKPIRESGYDTIDIVKTHPVLTGLGEAPIVRHAHRFELKETPKDFDILASTEMCKIQMIAHKTRPVVGTQFHPEYYTDEHPAGRIMIENFCKMAGLL